MNKLVIATQDHITFIDEDEIIYCRSDSNYTNIFMINTDELLISKSLAKFSKELTQSKFIRVNQSYLVNIQYIKSIDKRKRKIHLTNTMQIHFSSPIKDILLKLGHKGIAIVGLFFSVGY